MEKVFIKDVFASFTPTATSELLSHVVMNFPKSKRMPSDTLPEEARKKIIRRRKQPVCAQLH